MKKILSVLCAAMAFTAFTGVGPASADAAPKSMSPRGGKDTSMLLTVYTMNDGSSETSTKLGAWYLDCFPPSGTHPDYKHACRVLKEVDGWVEAIDRDDRACTKEYKPVTLRIEGTWKGRDLYWTNYYGNRCEAAAATRDVFPAA